MFIYQVKEGCAHKFHYTDFWFTPLTPLKWRNTPLTPLKWRTTPLTPLKWRTTAEINFGKVQFVIQTKKVVGIKSRNKEVSLYKV